MLMMGRGSEADPNRYLFKIMLQIGSKKSIKVLKVTDETIGVLTSEVTTKTFDGVVRFKFVRRGRIFPHASSDFIVV